MTGRKGLKIPFEFAINFSGAAGRVNIAKVYWCGTATVCQDVPTELKFHPNEWGWAEFK